MFKSLFFAAALLLGAQSQAINLQSVVSELNSNLSSVVTQGMFNFKVGDTASFKITMGFLPGTMVMSVTDVQANEVTLSQVVSMLGNKQECITKMDPNTGENKSTVCNGQQQQPSDQGDIELVDQKEDTVTVPAGTFTCLYIKAKQKSNGNEIEQWINPTDVPVLGMVKATMPSQLGKAIIELTSFKRM